MTAFFHLYRQQKRWAQQEKGGGSLAVFSRRMIRRHPVPRKLWKTCWQGAFWRVTRHHWSSIALQTLGCSSFMKTLGSDIFFFAVFFLLPLIGAMQTRRSRVLFELQLAWAEQTTCPLHGSTKATSNWNCWNSSMHASCGLASILFETLFLTQELPSNPRFSENPSLLVCARLSWQWLQDVARLDQFSCQNCFERQMEDNIIALLSTL